MNASCRQDATTITTVGAREVNADGSTGTTTGNITFVRNSSTVNTLNLGGDLTVTASNGGGVNFYSAVASATGVLTLNAGDHISLYGGIAATGPLSVNVNADRDNNGTGNVVVDNAANLTVDTRGGDFNVTGVNYSAASSASRTVSINTGSGNATLNMTGTTLLVKMSVAQLNITTAGKNGDNLSIQQGSTNDTLTVTGATIITSTAMDGKINLANNNSLQGNINLSRADGYLADAWVKNSAATTTLNNISVAGSLTVNTDRHLTVSGRVEGIGSDGLAASPVTTALALNFGQGNSDSTFTATANGAIRAGDNIGDDTVTITLKGGNGNDTFDLATAIAGTLNGGAGNDRFNLNAAGLAIADLSGGGGNDTLRGGNEIASWLISGSDAGKITTTGSNTINFSGIKNLIGGNRDDTFTLGDVAAISDTLDGWAGRDTIHILTAEFTRVGAVGDT